VLSKKQLQENKATKNWTAEKLPFLLSHSVIFCLDTGEKTQGTKFSDPFSHLVRAQQENARSTQTNPLKFFLG